MPKRTNKRTILFFGVSLTDMPPIGHRVEYSRIEKVKEAYDKNGAFHLEADFGSTTTHLRRAVEENNPTILHISCHGKLTGEMWLADRKTKGKKKVPVDALAKFIEYHNKTIECVFLNSCYSTSLAEKIKQRVNYVVASSSTIPVTVAIEFAQDFYYRLFAEDDYEESFCYAYNRIEMDSLTKEVYPVLYKNGVQSDLAKKIEDLKAKATVIEEDSQSIEQKRSALRKHSKYGELWKLLQEKRKAFARFAVEDVTRGWDEDEKAFLLLETANIFENVLDSILLEDKIHLVGYVLPATFEKSNYVHSLQELLNRISTYREFPKDGIKILKEYMEYLLDEIG